MVAVMLNFGSLSVSLRSSPEDMAGIKTSTQKDQFHSVNEVGLVSGGPVTADETQYGEKKSNLAKVGYHL